MKIISKDIRKGFVKVEVQNLDDLWYLSQIIDTGDLVKGVTFRKVRIGDSSERSSNVVKKKVFLEIAVEKVEFHKYSDMLRVSGKVTEGTEDIPASSYHTLNVGEGTVISIQKESFLSFQLDKLNEAAKEHKTKVLICVFDREQAVFALMKNYGFDILSAVRGEVQKKHDADNTRSGSFYKEIISQLKEYDKKYSLNRIVVASPSFWKDYLFNELGKDELTGKIITSSCNSVGENAINEVIRRPEIRSALSEDRIIRESNLVEELFSAVSRAGHAAYGLVETENAVNLGAVKTLLVTDSLIKEMREKNSYGRLDRLMKNADSMRAEVHLVSSEHEGGKKLDGLGGIGAVLRFKMQFAQ